MDDAELDDLLTAAAQPLDPRVEAAVAELVRSSRARARRATAVGPRPRRRRLVTGGVVLGAVVLTAGGTLTAAQLGLPPFQTLEPGVQRVLEPIPVDYTTETGKDVRCQAFLEFRQLTDEQIEAAETYVTDRDWSGFGQQAYDAGARAADDRTPDAIDRAFGEVLDDELADAAREAVPGASIQDPDAAGPAYNGHSMSCATGQR